MPEETFSERVASLRSELQSYGRDISDHMQSLFGAQPTALTVQPIDLTLNPLNAIPMLQNDVLELLKESKSQGEDSATSREELRECEKLVSTMKKLADVIDAIETATKYTSSCDLKKACESLASLEAKVEGLPSVNTEVGSGAVVALLRKEAKLVRYQFSARVRRLMKASYQISAGRITVTKLLAGVIKGEEDVPAEPLPLADIWTALLATEQAEATTTDILHSLWTHILLPLWKEKRVAAPKISIDEQQSSLCFESLAKISAVPTLLSPLEEDATRMACRIPLPQLLESIGQVLSFLWSELYGAHEELIVQLSTALYSPPSSLQSVLAETLMAHLPKLETDITVLQKQLDKPVRDLENKLKSLRLLPTPFLSDFLADLAGKYIAEKRSEILSRARDVVLADYHNAMFAAGDAQEDDPSSAGDIGDSRAMMEQSGSFTMQALRFDHCQVSLAACRILKLVHEVMKQAVCSSADVAKIMYHSARDCLELFLAIVPVKFEHIITTVPRMGAVFFNDCQYIAHNCVLISHIYRQELGKVNPMLLETSGFIDLIPRFRAAGEEVLTAHLQEQKQTLLELVGRINVSPSGESTEQRGRAVNDEEGATMLVRHMQKLSGQWQSVLQDPVYERLIGYLTESILRACMESLLQAECISETAGSDINRIFKTLLRIRNVFPDSADKPIAAITASWSKFIALTDLLEYNLTDVSEALPKRKFAGFTCFEMTTLIRALFQESPKRQLILSAIVDMAS